MNDDKLCIFPDALIAMIVTEAQDRALAQMSGPEGRGRAAVGCVSTQNGRAGPQYPAQG